MVSDELSAFLAQTAARRKPVDTLGGDCGLWLADWYAVATGGPDPAAHIRGCYFYNIDLPYTVRDITRRLGLKRTRSPECGDIGLISLRKGHLMGAIFTSTHWAMLEEGFRLAALSPECLRFSAAWRIA